MFGELKSSSSACLLSSEVKDVSEHIAEKYIFT
jgi:hypothetical protein